LRGKAEARPVGRHRAVRRSRVRQQVAAVKKPRQRFFDLLGGKLRLERGNELAKALFPLPHGGRQRMVQLAVWKEFSILRVEENGMGGQQVDGEIRREARNVFAGVQCRAAPAIGLHDVSTRTLATLRTAGAWRIPVAGASPSDARRRLSI